MIDLSINLSQSNSNVQETNRDNNAQIYDGSNGNDDLEAASEEECEMDLMSGITITDKGIKKMKKKKKPKNITEKKQIAIEQDKVINVKIVYHIIRFIDH